MLLAGAILGAVLAAQAAPQAAAVPAPAGAAPAGAEAPAPAKPAPPKKVCVEETKLGSHFKQRICATPEEWERRRLQDTEAMARTGGRSGTVCTAAAC